MSGEVTFTEEQQNLVDRLVGEARTKARDQAQAQAAASNQAAREEAERAALEAAANWEQLAKKESARVRELEPLQQQVAAYQEVMDKLLADRVKALGTAAETAVKALPDSMTALEKMAWLSANGTLFQAAGDGGGTPRRPEKPATDQDGKKKFKPRYPIRM